MSELARSVEEVLTRLVETLPESVATLERGPGRCVGPGMVDLPGHAHSLVGGARGRARIGSGEVGDLWRQVFTNPLRRTRKRVYAYDPYD